MHERRIGLLELTTRDGVTAWSECVAFQRPIYSAETIDTAWMAIRDWLAPRLLDRPLDGPDVVAAILAENVRGHNMAKAALEMGCWALAAEIQNAPLSANLGGTRERVPTGISLGIQSAPDALVARALDAVAAGYRKIKVKIQPGRDVEYVRAVREALGPDVASDGGREFRLHARRRRPSRQARRVRAHHARAAARRRRPRSPSRACSVACRRRSASTSRSPSVDRAEDMIALGSGRIVNIKPGRVGGLPASKAIHDLCRSAGVPVWCGGMLESGIGRALQRRARVAAELSLPGDLSPSAGTGRATS